MQKAVKLTLDEFTSSFLRVKPPTGWGKKIGVAYSGGVDSTTLLYLVNKAIRERSHPSLKDLSLLAIHIDHGFRPSSQQTAEHCGQWSQQYNIPYVMKQIPWSSPPFSSLEVTDTNKEEMGRLARYRLFLSIMVEQNIDVLLMAHHLDDQIETALMRQRRSKPAHANARLATTGLAGMRGCRRWGMGDKLDNEMRFYGVEGMSHWICRPLLTVSKDRLKATAEEEKLKYVEDETNADATLTERNAIRKELSNTNHSLTLRRPHVTLRPATVLPSTKEPSLAEVVQEYVMLRDDIDTAVDQWLRENTEASPLGTYHIITSRSPPPSPLIQVGIVTRILRYVSPEPWGSKKAEAERMSGKLFNIIRTIWPYATEEEWQKYREDGYFWSFRGKFSGSGKVLWHPTPLVGVPTPRSMKQIQTGYSEERTYGWLAMRQPPWVHRKPSWIPKKPQFLNGRLLPPDDQVNVDVTEQVARGQAFSILWDARWLLEFSDGALGKLIHRELEKRLDRYPRKNDRFLITAANQWYQPALVYTSTQLGEQRHHKLVQLVDWQNAHQSGAVKMTFVRPIDAL